MDLLIELLICPLHPTPINFLRCYAISLDVSQTPLEGFNETLPVKLKILDI